MADSGNLRTRRWRYHRAGNHSLCRRSTCPDAPAVAAVPPSVDAREAEPVQAMRDLAATLAEAYRADPGNALLAREYRLTLQALAPAARPKADDDIADLFAELRGS